MSKDILYPLRRFHGFLHDKIELYKGKRLLIRTYIKPLKEKLKQNPHLAFLVLTPEHGNLGDHAIASSEFHLLNSLNIDYIEITGRQLSELQKHHLLSCMNGHTILVHGGGFLGTLWFSAEELTRNIIQSNPDSSILSLPNTIYYENSDWGENEKNESAKVYNRHKKLFFCAREKYSYDIMKNLYHNVKLIPDMVLFLNKSEVQKARNGCLLCLRSDCEKTRTEEQERAVLQQAQSLFEGDVSFTDMCVDHPVLPCDREKELDKTFDEFRSATLVITDRLHGMIFCAVTGTPCIVINSKSHKVKGCYDWIKHLPYIQFVDDISLISTVYNRMPDGPFRYENSSLSGYYQELLSDIERIL